MTIRERVIIKGHQRCGNNYLINLIGVNFFDRNYTSSSFSDGNDHCLLNILQKDVKYLYIVRSKPDVLKSVFNERYLYGLSVPNYEYFYDTPYVKMYNPVISSRQSYVTLLETKEYNNLQNHFFCCIDKSPSQWYDYHVNYYNELSKNNNIFIVSYDGLINNFQSEMDKISNYLLGIPKSVYENIQKRVGWFHKD